MQYDFMPRVGCRASVRHIGREAQPILIFDDFFTDPFSLVEYANQARFAPATTLYPGINAPVPQAYAQAVLRGIGSWLSTAFGVNPRSAKVAGAFMGIVTTPPDRLHPLQRLPHVDQPQTGQIAILHYLCDQTFGGTTFFRHRPTGYESLNRSRMREVGQHIDHELAAHGPPAPKYPGTKTALFEPIASVFACFNRLVAYRSELLHSGSVPAGAPLNAAPERGRLTVNLFIRFDSLAQVHE